MPGKYCIPILDYLIRICNSIEKRRRIFHDENGIPDYWTKSSIGKECLSCGEVEEHIELLVNKVPNSISKKVDLSRDLLYKWKIRFNVEKVLCPHN